MSTIGWEAEWQVFDAGTKGTDIAAVLTTC